ncbi:hypothetical protein Bbelb_422510 [Branchiostoma belcheri]|nr:hypothetical protein Bbelb_422510 [Branchiostoma belcheri]
MLTVLLTLLVAMAVTPSLAGYPSEDDEELCVQACERCFSVMKWPRFYSAFKCKAQCLDDIMEDYVVGGSSWALCKVALQQNHFDSAV